MNYLVGDIGNTSTRICILNDKFAIIRSINFETNNLFKKKNLKRSFAKFLNNKLNPKFLFSSVVPKGLREIKKEF